MPPLGGVTFGISVRIETIDAEAVWYIREIVSKAVGSGACRSTCGVLHRADRIESLIGASEKVVGIGTCGIDVTGGRCLCGAGAG